MALSTCEAENIAASLALQEIIWLRKLQTSLRITHNTPTKLHIENQAAIQVGNIVAPTKKRKHIDIKSHHINHHVKHGTVQLQHIPSEKNPADILTKPLSPVKHTTVIDASNLTPRPPPTDP